MAKRFERFEITNKIMKKSEIRATRLTSDIARLFDKLAHTKGLKSGEYLRNLVIADLDGRNLMTTMLKRKLGLVWEKRKKI